MSTTTTVKAQHGWGLMEVLITLLIIAAVSAVAYTTLSGARDRGKDSLAQTAVNNTVLTAATVWQDTEAWPSGLAARLSADEPSLGAVTSTGTFPAAGSVDVAPNANNTLTVRATSKSGNGFSADYNPATGTSTRIKYGPAIAANPYVNLVRNPSLEVDTSFWDAVWSTAGMTGVAATRTASAACTGSYALRLQATQPNDTVARAVVVHTAEGVIGNMLPVTVGQAYTASACFNITTSTGMTASSGIGSGMWLRQIYYAADGTTFIGYYDSPFNILGGSTGIYRPTVTATAPVGSAYASVAVYGRTNTANAVLDMTVDSLIFTQTPTVVPYFDGGSRGGAWAGTPNASTSTGYGWGTW